MKIPVSLLFVFIAISILFISCDEDDVTAPAKNRPPTASISNPADGQSFVEGDTVGFSGTGIDPEDGALPRNSLVWTSDKDGLIGVGSEFRKHDLSVNTHDIILTAADVDGRSDTDTVTIHVNPPPPVKVLFIGNSAFNYNNLPDIFTNLAVAGGKDVMVDSRIQNGSHLIFHAENQETEDKINQDQWDYVILYGSPTTIGYPDTHHIIFPPYEWHPVKPALITLRQKILTNCSTTKMVYCMPWAFADGNSWVEGYDDDYFEMQQLIYDNTLLYSDEVPFVIAPVGWAWNEVMNSGVMWTYLFNKDWSHPSRRGSYLMACVVYSTVFQESTVGNTYYSSILEDDAKYIQSVASDVVLDDLELWNIIPLVSKRRSASLFE